MAPNNLVQVEAVILVEAVVMILVMAEAEVVPHTYQQGEALLVALMLYRQTQVTPTMQTMQVMAAITVAMEILNRNQRIAKAIKLCIG